MKMVKSLLLGSATGLVAAAGAQAADLPVKAKAVEYVKVCSLYGVGYYYIPGTDTCIKIGGYVRFEAYHNGPDGAYPNYSSNIGAFTRTANTYAMQARFRLTADVRTQTEYGTLRSYFSMGINFLNRPNEPYDYAYGVPALVGTQAAGYVLAPGGSAALPAGTVGGFSFALERAFIQFAGFTIGRADSFFAFYNGAAYGLVPMQLDGSSGPAGLNVFAYTWQFGNGLSASVSLEDAFARSAGVLDISSASFSSAGALDTKGQAIPDIVANLRVDQSWGSAQIMGSLHQVGGRYWTTGPVGLNGSNANLATATDCSVAPAANTVNNLANTNACGHPGDKWGWAVGAGLTLNMPWDKKDTLSGVIAYSEGNTRAVSFGQTNNFMHKDGGFGLGIISDGIYRSPGVLAGYDGSIQLTKSWGGTVAFEHYWTPSLRTSWVFGYLAVEYNDTAKALMLRGGDGTGTAFNCRIAQGGAAYQGACNPDWSVWRLASRTMWNPVANLDVGLEVAYTKLNTGFAGATTTTAAQFGTVGLMGGKYVIEDQDVWTATVRVQRSFWP
jgi:hypothetical protein